MHQQTTNAFYFIKQITRKQMRQQKANASAKSKCISKKQCNTRKQMHQQTANASPKVNALPKSKCIINQ